MNLPLSLLGFLKEIFIISLQIYACQTVSFCGKILIIFLIQISITNVCNLVSSMHDRILCVDIIWPLYERDNTGLKPVLHTAVHSML